ncbi:patatin-like phospholipase family protein [Phenylobacterium sp. LjRoot219]|uniref:patatin-like phospholipase family protein n=1 Tax=Phenylobacterium sp. LjRoot219 TaxID=3342283 RepID=UPI003ECEDCD4
MTRALVLGGGGPLGVAWESGLIAGFAQGGVDLGQADYILGTSAGAIVGARLASGVAAASLADAQLDPAQVVHPPAGGSPETMMRMGQLMREGLGGTRNPAEVRRELGALALAAGSASEASFLEIMGRELGPVPQQGWPARGFACTAVDVEDGGFQLWQADSGVDLLPAVASSACVPGLVTPITLKGRRYMDGGMRSPTNADLAVGHDLVVLIAVQPPAAAEGPFAKLVAEEVESLQSGGATVVVVTLDDGSAAVFGANPMDAAKKPEVARAALAQGLSQAAVLKDLWG